MASFKDGGPASARDSAEARASAAGSEDVLDIFEGLVLKDESGQKLGREGEPGGDDGPMVYLPPAVMEEAAAMKQAPRSSYWLKAVAIVHFDIKFGQRVETIVPANACNEEEKKRIALLSLPDSYSGHDGNMLFSFRVRTNPESYTETSDRTFLHGHAFFTREKDPGAARGFHQRAVVYLTDKPYAALYRTLAEVTGPLYFEFGEGMLDTIVMDVAAWPKPVPGTKMKFPIAGTTLSYRVPFLHEALVEETISRSKSNPPSPARKPKPKQALGIQRSASVESGGEFLGPPEINRIKRGASAPVGREAGGKPSSTSPAIKSIYDVFDISGQDRSGLFQSVGLYSTFGPALSPSMWQIWELLICGESLMVYAPTPDLCSRAVFALVSLLGPFPFAGDFRPYFTIYDCDFNAFAESIQSDGGGSRKAKGARSLPLVLGVTNPFFLKSFEKWPNILSLGQGSNNVHLHKKVIKPTTWGRSKALQKAAEANGVPYFLVSRNAILPSNGAVVRQLLPVRSNAEAPHQGGAHDDGAYSIKRVNSIPCVFERRGNDANASGETTLDGKVGIQACPEDAINNALLRQHFRNLTEQFLRPFDQLFGIPTAQEGNGGPASKSEDRFVMLGFGPYSRVKLPAFDQASFMKGIKLNGMPRAFQILGMKSKWIHLYDRFISSAHFMPWLQSRQHAHRAHLIATTRALRADLKAKDLVRSTAPTLYDMVRSRQSGKKAVPKREIDSLSAMLDNIKQAIEKEMEDISGGDGDEALLEKMWEHFFAVRAILPDRFASAGSKAFGENRSQKNGDYI
jgi:hypothetical protein